MQTKTNLSFITLLLMISFASVNAVLFTPALPSISHFFAINESTAQQTITWFLVGYAVGQLIYGPMANRFGRKPALYGGISLQILSSFLCVFSGKVHVYFLLVLGRFLLALGSGVGLKMTFTLLNECYEPKIVSQKIAYLMLAFAITPGLGVALGGLLTTYYGWQSCFYVGAIYGVILLFLIARLPETKNNLDYDALKIKNLIDGYRNSFKNRQLMMGGLLMGGATCFVYVFAAVAPFVAMNLLGMNSSEYGIANIIPTLGLVIGSLCSAQFIKIVTHHFLIEGGILIAGCSAVLMLVAVLLKLPALYTLFIPQMLSYVGLSFVFANASTIAMSHISDKAHGSAVMNFINMGSTTIIVLSLGYFKTTQLLLPIVYIIICASMIGIFKGFIQREIEE